MPPDLRIHGLVGQNKRRAKVPVRIYALAKELNLDGKELVEICKKAGISGKGSALASLDDDEVTKVHAFLDKSTVVEEPEEPVEPEPEESMD